MKKRIIAGMMAVCLLMLVGCGQSGANTDNTTQKKNNIQSETAVDSSETAENGEGTDMTGSSSDVLVVYFSRTGEQYRVGVIDKGNTAIVADMIVEQTGADSFEILPKEDYPYTYKELTDVAKKELNENARPAYAGKVPDLSQYKTVFIGAPVWWGD